MNIRKVAQQAGVSVATISRVLNHPEQVLPETREHVLAIMKKLDYTPNWFARGLNLGTTNTIALLIPSLETKLYQKIITGIETVARNKHYAVFFCNTYGDAQVEYDCLKMMGTRRVDGVVLVSSQLGGNRPLPLSELGIPCVHVGKKHVEGCETMCYIDYEEAACRLSTHLLGFGYETIDLLLCPLQTLENQQIEAGLQRAQRMMGRSIRYHIRHVENDLQAAYTAAHKMILQNDMPRAVITSSAEQALGVLKAAQDASIPIPQQLALSSMTDTPVCAIVSPPITAIEHPAAKLGMSAARLLFDSIENKDLELGVPQEMILQPKLKIRKSCGNTKYIYELFD